MLVPAHSLWQSDIFKFIAGATRNGLSSLAMPADFVSIRWPLLAVW
jgi:hypothetical protein